MATVTPTKTPGTSINEMTILWEGFVTSGDVGTPVRLPDFFDRCVQIYGSFTGSLEITLQGSNDPTADPAHANYATSVWFSLTDPQGNAIVKTAAAGKQVLENPLWIRPKATAGSGGGDADVVLFMRGNRNG